MWKRWLIDIPARLYDLWWTVYWAVLAVLTAVCFGMLAITLIAWFIFGIRWGW